uniref:Helicase-associated domain-containing protein n=1 Tax=Attheya septentrionalis TaxID=420275 RepID=A0A7S2UIP0_9STRA
MAESLDASNAPTLETAAALFSPAEDTTGSQQQDLATMDVQGTAAEVTVEDTPNQNQKQNLHQLATVAATSQMALQPSNNQDVPITGENAPTAKNNKRKRGGLPLGRTNTPKEGEARGKMGRPKGSKDKKKRRRKSDEAIPRPSNTPKEQCKGIAASEDREKAEKALRLLRARERKVKLAEKEVAKTEAELTQAQKKLETAKETVVKAKTEKEEYLKRSAKDLAIVPGIWNDMYWNLEKFHKREGHILISKRDADHCEKDGIYDKLSDAHKFDYRKLSKWLGKQRTAHRQGGLSAYQDILLNDLGINWDPPQGPRPSIWQGKFTELKEFHRIHGHFKVPKTTITSDGKSLRSWVKVAITQYRNTREGKKPALSEERIQQLEEIGFDWGVPRVLIPWETRFRELQNYKEEFGNCDVPWRWTRNRPLAGWVNAQRNKYRDSMYGKKALLTPEQIQQLNEIGFRWSSGIKTRPDKIRKEENDVDEDQDNEILNQHLHVQEEEYV